MTLRKPISFFWTLTIVALLISCGGSIESQDRAELISSFENNFGFKPPNSVKQIKLRNWSLYDATAHWMAFTYDSGVLSRIIAHDQPLKIASGNTFEFLEIVKEIQKNAHNPGWLHLPGAGTDRIYYKKNFLDHTFSEYYLWTGKENEMTFLYVHYFD
jgi:hypothetical protein